MRVREMANALVVVQQRREQPLDDKGNERKIIALVGNRMQFLL
jgi:hypothetical protein